MAANTHAKSAGRPRGGQGHGGRGGPRPKLENPWGTLGRVLKFVGKNYGIHLVLVVICIFVSVFATVQGTLFTKTLSDSYILPMVKTVRAGGTADFGPLLAAMARVACFYGCGVLASSPDDLCVPGLPAESAERCVPTHAAAPHPIL